MVNIQWNEKMEEPPQIIAIQDLVVITGYSWVSTFSMVTVRKINEESNMKYNRFQQLCNEEALRSPELTSATVDTKVLANSNKNWYRGIVTGVKGNIVVVNLKDLGKTIEYPMEELKLLHSTEIFFEVDFTSTFRLQGLRDMPVFTAQICRGLIETCISKEESFDVSDIQHNNYIILNYAGKTESLNRRLLYNFERQMGLQESNSRSSTPLDTPMNGSRTASPIQSVPGPVKQVTKFTFEQLKYPVYEPELTKVKLFICDCKKGVQWKVNAFIFSYAAKIQENYMRIQKFGPEQFKKPAPTDGELDINDMVIVAIEADDGAKEYHRCRFLGKGKCVGLDTGKTIDDVPMEWMRFLPRDLLLETYLLECILQDYDSATEQYLDEHLLGNIVHQTVIVDSLTHIRQNIFSVRWDSIVDFLKSK